jgi:hypothetical protein
LGTTLLVWFLGLRHIDPNEMNDYGRVSVMPYSSWQPFVLLALGLFITFDRHWALPAMFLVALIVVLHATPAVEYGAVPRYPWTYKHLGIVDYLQRHHGHLYREDRFLGVYHNWPGLFLATYWVVDLLGGPRVVAMADLVSAARWCSLILNLAYLAVIPLVLRELTTDRRLIVSACWIFVCGNWIGQDYYSPQGVAFLLFLLMQWLCLRYLARPQRMFFGLPWLRWLEFLNRGAPTPRPTTRWQRALASLGVLCLIFMINATHQLTPLAVILTLGVFMLVRGVHWGFLLASVGMFAFWSLYVAAGYVLPALETEISLLGETHIMKIDASLTSEGQAFVAACSRLLTGLVVVAGVMGGLRRLFHGKFDGAPALMIVVMAPLIVLPYGGEITFRIYMYTLLCFSFFAAAVFFPTIDKGRGPFTRVTLCAYGLALSVLFVAANNGNDRQFVVSAAEVDAVSSLFKTAPPNTLLLEANANYPTQLVEYEKFFYVPLDRESDETKREIVADPAKVLSSWMDDRRYQAAFVVITRTMKAYADAVRTANAYPDIGGFQSGALDKIEKALAGSPKFRTVVSNQDVKVFALRP